MGHYSEYSEYSVALDFASAVAFSADYVEVGLQIVVELVEAGSGIVAEPVVAGPDIVVELGTVAAAVLACDTVAAVLDIDVAVESDQDNVAVAEADRIVAVAFVPGIAVAHGLSVVVVISVLDIAVKIVFVADDTAGIEAAVGIVVETVKYNEKCVKKRQLLA